LLLGIDGNTKSAMDRRRTPRQLTIKMGHLAFGNAVENCVVFDLSRSGARIWLLNPVGVSEAVVLHLSDGGVFNARRCWERGDEVGFEFMGAAVPRTPLGAT
jgi:hypothetical protein